MLVRLYFSAAGVLELYANAAYAIMLAETMSLCMFEQHIDICIAQGQVQLIVFVGVSY